MPVIFPPAILEPEMAAPILWAPGIFWFFLLENSRAHKIPRFRGGGSWVSWKGEGSADFVFMGVGIFPEKKKHVNFVPHFLGKTAKKGPTQTFSGGIWGSKAGSPVLPIRPK